MHLRAASLPLLIALIASDGAATAQQAASPFAFVLAELKPLEAVALDLQALGRSEDAAAVREALAGFGMPPKVLTALDRRLQLQRPAGRSADRVRTRCRTALAAAAAALAGRLGDCADDDRRRELATAILRLDAETPAARRAIGQIEIADTWIRAVDQPLAARMGAIQAALQQLRGLQPECSVAASSHELLLAANGQPGHVVAANGITIHTGWPVGQTERLIGNLLRAVAFSRFLLDDATLELPRDLVHTSVLLTGDDAYARALQFDREHQLDAPSDADVSKLAAYHRKDGTLVNNRVTESHALGGIFSHLSRVVSDRLYDDEEAPTLIVGHANWALMALAGAHLPGIAFRVDTGGGGGKTAAAPMSVHHQLLQGAGLMGARSWLRSEVAAGTDPAWSRSFRPQVGMIEGVDMLKTTFVAEYLHLRGPLRPVMTGARGAVGKGPAEATAAIEAALGVPLADFEQQWREWLRGVPAATGLLQRLADAGGDDGGDGAVLAHLVQLRQAAFTHPWLQDLPPLLVDPDLSRGAALHARYLERYPDQAAAWPDAHEEFTDRDGFTPEGCWSGNHSVIHPDVTSPTAAIDGWMGTFFHRLPLLDPGLMQIGWSLVGTTCVLDSGSVVREVGIAWEVVWPPNGMQDVPRRFAPELPNPFPGRDQSGWGYPITLQLGPRPDAAVPVLELSLRRGSATGKVVECLVSSPQQPGNPLLAPAMAWCLIPVELLAPETVYVVHATLRGAELGTGGTELEWSFRTGR